MVFRPVCLLLLVCLFSPQAKTGSEQQPLPVPLTLEFAISEGTGSSHPALMAAQAEERVAEAELEDAESNYALESSVRLTAGWVQPNELALDQTHDDHSAQLNVRKVLYDFGVTGKRVGAAESLIFASKLEYEYTRQQQVVDIARHYFDVLLADLKYAWDNETMAMHYVRYDRIRERHGLQQVSDVELLQSENSYQTALTQRRASENRQRTSRALLAVAINRPGELSIDLVRPELNVTGLKLEELDALVSAAVRNNLEMQSSRHRENAARLDLNAAQKRVRPTLDATLQLSEYSRLTPNRDDARARLNLVIPLNENGLQRSEIAEKRAEWLQASADLMQLETELRRRVAETWQSILQLQVRQQELDVAAARTELELDKARGEYELEIRTHLGDAMVNTSRVRYEKARTHYELALAWMQLYLMTGKNPEQLLTRDGA
ncbi:MAG: TolC family protein [Thiotrichales bacterium]|nr:MAG: TolC family protein [Thiotrichales bacterium]